MALAVSMGKELGVKHFAMPTQGNAGSAMAAYATAAGLRSTVLAPEDAPDVTVREIALQGAGAYKVNGLINDCGKIVGDGKESVGWFDASTLKEPYRIEGKKTMGMELAEQLGWRLPDVIFYPTGGGTGLIGMWKAFAELKKIGWLTGALPRMVAVQATGCAPMVKAWEDGVEHAPLWENAHTIAGGMRGSDRRRRFPDPARGPGERRLRHRGGRRRHHRHPGRNCASETDCCSARKARRLWPPTRTPWRTGACRRTTKLSCSTARPV